VTPSDASVITGVFPRYARARVPVCVRARERVKPPFCQTCQTTNVEGTKKKIRKPAILRDLRIVVSCQSLRLSSLASKTLVTPWGRLNAPAAWAVAWPSVALRCVEKMTDRIQVDSDFGLTDS
jgi:hypothetical protein